MLHCLQVRVKFVTSTSKFEESRLSDKGEVTKQRCDVDEGQHNQWMSKFPLKIKLLKDLSQNLYPCKQQYKKDHQT